jgi:hypothetical protein
VPAVAQGQQLPAATAVFRDCLSGGYNAAVAVLCKAHVGEGGGQHHVLLLSQVIRKHTNQRGTLLLQCTCTCTKLCHTLQSASLCCCPLSVCRSCFPLASIQSPFCLHLSCHISIAAVVPGCLQLKSGADQIRGTVSAAVFGMNCKRQ